VTKFNSFNVSQKSIYGPQAIEYETETGFVLGPLASYKMRHDPRYLLFMLARYKTAAKYLRGKKNILEVGCGDGFALPILLQEAEKVTAIDIEPDFITDNRRRFSDLSDITFKLHNILKNPMDNKFDAAISFDVYSSIPLENINEFFTNISNSIEHDGLFVLGVQNKIATVHSLPQNIVDQPSFPTYEDLKLRFETYFTNSFILSMNDETVHTGRETMAQYFIAIGVGPKLAQQVSSKK
jgi:SAM-dependent methyltransferase